LEGDFADGETTPRTLREVEAEAVALLCCESLGLEGADFGRAYIQNWLRRGSGIDGETIPEYPKRVLKRSSAPPIKSSVRKCRFKVLPKRSRQPRAMALGSLSCDPHNGRNITIICCLDQGSNLIVVLLSFPIDPDPTS